MHSQNKGDVLYSSTFGENRFELGSDLVESLNFYYSNHITNRQILTYSQANLDDVLRKAGQIQFVKELTTSGDPVFRNLYRQY